jgi:hypothetical protein
MAKRVTNEENKNIQLELGSTATSYSSYKTATTPVTLRSNATTQDTYDMNTGIHVQKVNSSTYETLATQIITQYGKGSFIDTTKTIPKRIY